MGITPSRTRRVLIIGSWTFFLGFLLNYGSITALQSIPILPSVVVLIVVVLIGIIFDTIGTAAAAGQTAPFSAMASRRVPGSKQALSMVQNADGVASFCNDMVGDICGTLSGALAATIVFRVAIGSDELIIRVINVGLLSLVAAVTVIGKSVGKTVAILHFVSVLMAAGRFLYVLDGGLRNRLISRFHRDKTDRRR